MRSFMQAVRQVGYAVRNLDAALRHFESVNGTAHKFDRFQVDLDAGCSYQYRGEPATCLLDVALTHINGMDHEFIQVLDGLHPAREYLEHYGEGINHFALYLEDLSVYEAQAVALGANIVAQGAFPEPTNPTRRFSYLAFETRPNPLYELVELRSLDR